MVERTEREELLSYISDARKDAYGSRGTGEMYVNCSIEELRAEAESLSEAVARSIEREEEEQNHSVVRFEKVIAELIASGAKDRETAIRWHKDSLDDIYASEDDEYYCYLNNLPYNYFKVAA